MFRILLEFSPQRQNGQVVQFQFRRQLTGGLTFQNASQEQNQLLGREVMLLQHGFGVQVVNMLTVPTTVNLQLALAGDAKQVSSLNRRMAPMSPQPLVGESASRFTVHFLPN
jgi:hypothetical protein